MTLTSGSLGPSQCSSCLKTSQPLLMALTLAVLARLCSSRLRLLKPLRPPGKDEDEEEES